MRVDAIWKIKTALASPPPSSVTVPPPVIENVPAADLYTPLVRVTPARSVAILGSGVRPTAAVYAALKSLLAVVSSPALVIKHAVPTPPPPVYPPLVSYIVPVTSAHVSAVIAVPPVGLKPTCPVTLLAPVPVTAAPARIAKTSAVPRSILAVAANTIGGAVIYIYIRSH